MEESVLDQISQRIEIIYNGWRNGKNGAICDVKGNGIFRFIECYRGENGMWNYFHSKTEDNPIVCVGIAAHWLVRRKSASNLLTKLTQLGAHMESLDTVRQMYEHYTEMRFRQYKDSLRDDPMTWDWEEDADWKEHFYCDYIIPHEIELNAISELLFGFISDDDIQKLRLVMGNYIKYLEKCHAAYQQKPTEKLIGVLDTKLAREIFAKCIEKGWMHETDTGYEWDGIPETHGKVAQLAYLCGKIYEFKYSEGEGSNIGKRIPDTGLCKLFNVESLEKQLYQVYQAIHKQKWRTIIDEIFE